MPENNDEILKVVETICTWSGTGRTLAMFGALEAVQEAFTLEIPTEKCFSEMKTMVEGILKKRIDPDSITWWTSGMVKIGDSSRGILDVIVMVGDFEVRGRMSLSVNGIPATKSIEIYETYRPGKGA